MIHFIGLVDKIPNKAFLLCYMLAQIWDGRSSDHQSNVHVSTGTIKVQDRLLKKVQQRQLMIFELEICGLKKLEFLALRWLLSGCHYFINFYQPGAK